MSAGELFQLTGAAAGLAALMWLIVMQLFGTYEARTIREVLLKQNEALRGALEQLEELAAVRRPFRKRQR